MFRLLVGIVTWLNVLMAVALVFVTEGRECQIAVFALCGWIAAAARP